MLRNLDTCSEGVITDIQGCLILALLGLSGSAQATTYYLAPTGVDSGPCTVQTQPCRSLERADALVNPGDEVRLAGGIYSQVVSIDSSGTASAPITWLPLGNSLPILDGPTTTSTRLLTINANWNVWQGIDVRDSGNGSQNPLAGIRQRLALKADLKAGLVASVLSPRVDHFIADLGVFSPAGD